MSNTEGIKVLEVNLKSDKKTFKWEDNTPRGAGSEKTFKTTEEPVQDFQEALADLEGSVKGTYQDLIKMETPIKLVRVKRAKDKPEFEFEFEGDSDFGGGQIELKLKSVTDADWAYISSFFDEAKDFITGKKRMQADLFDNAVDSFDGSESPPEPPFDDYEEEGEDGDYDDLMDE